MSQQTNEDLIIRTRREQAWARAKGELNALIATYWVAGDAFRDMTIRIQAFIKTVEDNGLQE